MLMIMAPVSSVAYTTMQSASSGSSILRAPSGLPRSGLCACGNGCNRAITLVSLVKEWSPRTQSQSPLRDVGLTEGNKCGVHSAHLGWVMLGG